MDNPLGKTIPIIAMTANAFVEDVNNSFAAGMNAHISKPIAMADLESTMRRLRHTMVGKVQQDNFGKSFRKA